MSPLKLLEASADFQQSANKQTFVGIWGEDLGGHLWGEFNRHDGNLLRFLKTLDSKNTALLAAAIEGVNHG